MTTITLTMALSADIYATTHALKMLNTGKNAYAFEPRKLGDSRHTAKVEDPILGLYQHDW